MPPTGTCNNEPGKKDGVVISEYLLWVVLLLLAALAGAVMYLLVSRRHFQRVDYGALLDQEERQRRLQVRIEQLEQMLGDLAEYDLRRRQELEFFVAAAKEELAAMVGRARSEIIDEVLNRPERIDSLLLHESGAGVDPVVQPPAQPRAGRPERDDSPNMVRFLKSERQQQIAEALELGYTSQEVSRLLGVSRHEVELVSAIIFKNRSA